MNVLQVNNISKSFEKSEILKDISFSVREGEIVGFIGPNGAGKTTTIRVITNLIYQDKGSVFICGHDILKERVQALSCTAAIVENPGLYTFLSGKDNIDFVRKINKISKEKMNEIIDFIGLKERIEDTVKKYSLGMKQRLALGICLLREPKLLILDEPTNGLDPSGTMELRSLLTKLSKEKKMSIFISSHALSEIEKICDRIIFIKDGKIVSTKANNNKTKILQTYKIHIDKVHKAKELLKDCDFVYEYSEINKEFSISIDKSSLSRLLKMFLANDLEFGYVEPLNSLLEKEYSDIYGEER